MSIHSILLSICEDYPEYSDPLSRYMTFYTGLHLYDFHAFICPGRVGDREKASHILHLILERSRYGDVFEGDALIPVREIRDFTRKYPSIASPIYASFHIIGRMPIHCTYPLLMYPRRDTPFFEIQMRMMCRRMRSRRRLHRSEYLYMIFLLKELLPLDIRRYIGVFMIPSILIP